MRPKVHQTPNAKSSMPGMRRKYDHLTYLCNTPIVKTMSADRGPRCRCQIGPGRFEVKARVERFVEPAILLLLAEGPSHGYELADGLEELLGDGRVDFGNLYRLLRSLESEGLLVSSWNEELSGPLKRTYALSDDGRSLLGTWVQSLETSQQRTTAFLERYGAIARFSPTI